MFQELSARQPCQRRNRFLPAMKMFLDMSEQFFGMYRFDKITIHAYLIGRDLIKKGAGRAQENKGDRCTVGVSTDLLDQPLTLHPWNPVPQDDQTGSFL